MRGESPAVQRLADALREMRAALETIADPAERRIALDALRDALDRDATTPSPGGIVAGSFTAEARIHGGPCFEVLRLRQRDLGTHHALKTVAPERRSDPLLRRLLLREAQSASRIDHPACLRVEAVLRLDDGRPAILSPFVEGPTLAERLAEHGPLEPGEAAALAHRLAAALGAVHHAGLVHLDLTPANVLLPGGDPARAILCDFGLAIEAGTQRGDAELEGAFSPAFAAPEQRDPAAALDARTDLHALGAVLRAAIGPGAGALAALAQALCRDRPEDRPSSAQDVVRRLAACGFPATEPPQR